MKVERIKKYVAADGEPFDSEEECLEHEERISGSIFVGLTEDQVEAARTLEDAELVAAFEHFADRLKKARKHAGIFRKKGSTKSDRRARGEPEHQQHQPPHQPPHHPDDRMRA